MKRTGKEIHIAYCSYMVEKAKDSILPLRKERKVGVKTSGMSRRELINALVG